MRSIQLLAGALGVTVSITMAAAPADARATMPVAETTVEVQGTLLVAQPDRPSSRPAYAVALADGDLVPISGPLGDARPLSHFTGRLALPTSIVSTLAARGTSTAPDATLGASSGSGLAALRLVDERSLTLRVSGTPVLTDPAPAVTPTAHQQYVAAIDNKGALGQRDTMLLGHVRTVGSYWTGQSNGAITRIGVPATVRHYKTTLSTTDCGLGSDFFDVVQEAAARIPGMNLFDGPNQLVLFVSPACSSGHLVGEGTVGDSFASGGALIVKAGTAIDGAYAHESGHNYGFEHANARSSGTSMEYFGLYDVMGFVLPGYNGLTALSTPFRVFQGITDVGEIQKVQLGNRSKAVHINATIKPRSDDAGLRSVRVVDPDTEQALYLDYRSGKSTDANAFYTAQGLYMSSDHGPVRYAPGVTLNAARDGAGVDTLVLDAKGDTSLGSGATWTNASGTLSIHVTAVGAGGAVVKVDFTPRTLAVSKPRIAGQRKVGKELTVKPRAWTRGTTFAYAWYAGGVRIRHATAKRLLLTKAQKGKRISVRVTGSHHGFNSRTLRSAKTPRVG